MVNVKYCRCVRILRVAVAAGSLSGLMVVAADAEPPDYYFPNAAVSTNGIVRTLLFFEGLLYVGGNFTSVYDDRGTHSRVDIAAYDTTTWRVTDFEANTNFGTVRALAARNGRLYVGGSFTRINRTSCSRLAALDPQSGEVIREFRRDGGEINNAVWALAVSDSAVYFGGAFSSVDDVPRSYLAAVDPVQGILDERFVPDPGDPFDDSGKTAAGVFALELHPENPSLVFAGGNFQTVAGVSDRKFLVALNADGSLGPEFVNMDRNPVIDIDCYGDYCYIAAGGYSNRVIAFRTDGDAYSREWRSVWVNGDVQAVACAAGRYVFFGCHDGVLDSTDDFRMGVVNASNGDIYDIYPPMNSFFGVRALAAAGRYLAVGGEFTRMNGKTQRYLAVFSEFPFTAEGILPPDVPELSSPDDSISGVELPPTLRWKFAGHAESYELQIAVDSQFTNQVYTRTGITALRQRVNGLESSEQYWWRVRSVNSAGTSEFSESRYFITEMGRGDIPSLEAPENGALRQSLTVDLRWLRSAKARSYHLLVAATDDFADPLVELPGFSDTVFSVAGLGNAKVYYWRVNATTIGGVSDWSPVWQFATQPGPDAVPVTVCPEDGATGQPVYMTLCWHPSTTAQSYTIQVSASRVFEALLIEQKNCIDTLLRIGGLSNSTQYFWRVNAQTVGGESDWSIAASFTTKAGAGDIPVPVNPPDGTIGLPTNVAFSWHPAGTALHYRLQCSPTDDFSAMLTDTDFVSDTGVTISGFEPVMQYFWRVNATTISGQSTWSAVQRFVTAPGSDEIPVVVYPVDGATGLPLSVECRWLRVEKADAYLVQLAVKSDQTTGLVNLANLHDTVCTLNTLAYGTDYLLRISSRTTGGPSEWRQVTFRTVAEASGIPRCVYPVDSAQQCPLSTVFRWELVENAGTYHIQVSSDSGFSEVLFDSSGCADTLVKSISLTEDAWYFWRVRCLNSSEIAWSDPQPFRTVYPLPDVPLPLAPVSGWVSSADSLCLVWNRGGPYVSDYRIEFATDSGMAELLVDSMITDTEFVCRQLNDSTGYWWRIRAYNATGWSRSSEPRLITTRFPPPPPQRYSLDKTRISRNWLIVSYHVAQKNDVQMELFNLNGKSLVRKVFTGRLPGSHQDFLPFGRLSTGTYLLSFKVGSFTRTTRISFTK